MTTLDPAARIRQRTAYFWLLVDLAKAAPTPQEQGVFLDRIERMLTIEAAEEAKRAHA